MPARRVVPRLFVIALAVALLVYAPPPAVVERWYAGRWLPIAQPALTWIANWFPFALYDVYSVAAIVSGVILLVIALARPKSHGRAALFRLAGLISFAFVFGMLTGGFSFRREPLTKRLAYHEERATHDALVALTERSINELNTLYPQLPRTWPDWPELSAQMAPAFKAARAKLDPASHLALPRVKLSLMDWYMRRATFNGMSLPFFYEITVNREMFGFERPYVLAHEWAHTAAGRGNESEAAFLGWLACMHGPAYGRYSAWLRMYGYAIANLPVDERRAYVSKLGRGPKADIDSVSARVARGYNRTIARVGNAGQKVMNSASHMPPGTTRYELVVRLILGMDVALPDSAASR
jgi:hypothetical protein